MILALEFSADLRGAAVLGGSSTPALASERTPRECGPMTLIERALNAAGIEREAIDCIAVGLGPGSYMGIRAAIATAQGWQLGRPVRLLGLSSLEVMAAQARTAGLRGNISVVVDAQRDEIYWGRYRLSNAGCESLQSLCLAAWTDLKPLIDQGEPLIGPNAALAGRGVKLVMPDAAALAVLAAERDDDLAPESLEPIYLRATSFVKAPPARMIPPLTPD